MCVTARLPASVTARGPAPIGMRDTFALPALYPLTLASLPNLHQVELKLKEKLNQFYLRGHHTPSASYASKRMLPLPLLRQRRRARSAISLFASLMLLNRALLRRKLQIVKQVGYALN